MFRPHDRPIDRADLLGHAEAVESQGAEAEDWSAGKGTLTDAVTQKLVGIKLDSNLQNHRYKSGACTVKTLRICNVVSKRVCLSKLVCLSKQEDTNLLRNLSFLCKLRICNIL